MAEGSTQPPHATRFIETTRGVLSYSQLAPLLAEQVLRLLEDIEEENYSGRALDEALLLDFHREICADLTPDWAGIIRRVEVRVGEHKPPPPHRLTQLLRDYSADLQARLNLPPVDLAPVADPARSEYLRALRAADSLDWRPLAALWRHRLETAASGEEA